MINIAEILQSHDPKFCSGKHIIQKETDGLEKRNTWEVVAKSSMPRIQTYSAEGLYCQ